jgi:hypothetical protein
VSALKKAEDMSRALEMAGDKHEQLLQKVPRLQRKNDARVGLTLYNITSAGCCGY